MTLDNYEVYVGPINAPVTSMMRWATHQGRDSLDLLAETNGSLRWLFHRWSQLRCRHEPSGGAEAGAPQDNEYELARRIVCEAGARLEAVDDLASMLARLGRAERAEQVWRSTDGVRSVLFWMDGASHSVAGGDPKTVEQVDDSVHYLEERWGADVRAEVSLADELTAELEGERSSLGRARHLRARSPFHSKGRGPWYRRLRGGGVVDAISGSRPSADAPTDGRERGRTSPEDRSPPSPSSSPPVAPGAARAEVAAERREHRREVSSRRPEGRGR